MIAPRLTIGLVVFNGERYLAEAIESIRAQTFTDFQLLVFDNASTDSTPEIVQRAAAADPRIRHIRHRENIGALANFIAAVEAADTPLFCWATHDDRRTPECLSTLISELDADPGIDLAACAARDLDPDGSPRAIRTETQSLERLASGAASKRLLAFLKCCPCTPVYGVFRTDAIRRQVPVLKSLARDGGGNIFGGDAVFFAAFLREHSMALSSRPMLLFRRGGISHDTARFKTLRGLLASLGEFNRALAAELAKSRTGWLDRQRLTWARNRLCLRLLLRSHLRGLLLDHLAAALGMQSFKERLHVRLQKPWRRLRSRLEQLPPNSKVVLFGAGKHTRRCLPLLQRVCPRHIRIVAVCDDMAPAVEPVGTLDLIDPSMLQAVGPAVLLVSTDTYEAAMANRARQIAPASARVWCIYDLSLEGAVTPPRERSPHAQPLQRA